jgi:hypothetical protein
MLHYEDSDSVSQLVTQYDSHSTNMLIIIMEKQRVRL